MMDRKSVKQFKLVTGEDLICEIIDDQDKEDLYVRNAFKMVTVERGEGMFTVFKPFMMFQESPTQIMMLRTDKIVSIAVPYTDLMTQYETAVTSFNEEMESYELDASDPMTEEEVEEFFDDEDDESELPTVH